MQLSSSIRKPTQPVLLSPLPIESNGIKQIPRPLTSQLMHPPSGHQSAPSPLYTLLPHIHPRFPCALPCSPALSLSTPHRSNLPPSPILALLFHPSSPPLLPHVHTSPSPVLPCSPSDHLLTSDNRVAQQDAKIRLRLRKRFCHEVVHQRALVSPEVCLEKLGNLRDGEAATRSVLEASNIHKAAVDRSADGDMQM